MQAKLLGLGLAMGLLLTALPAAADVIGAGASGQCYDAQGNGGQDEARVALDTADPAGASVTAPTGSGAAAAVVEFAEGVLTGRACTDPSFDYLEADARVGASYFQVCYGQNVLRTDGSCPQSPSGPS